MKQLRSPVAAFGPDGSVAAGQAHFDYLAGLAHKSKTLADCARLHSDVSGNCSAWGWPQHSDRLNDLLLQGFAHIRRPPGHALNFTPLAP
jgi:hypothetical protein